MIYCLLEETGVGMECPVCCCLVEKDLERHVNDHLDQDEIARDQAFAKHVASAPRSPSKGNSFNVVEYVMCRQGCGQNVLLTDWESHCLLHELEDKDVGKTCSKWQADEGSSSQEGKYVGKSSSNCQADGGSSSQDNLGELKAGCDNPCPSSSRDGCQWDVHAVIASQKRDSFIPIQEGLMFLLRKCLVVEEQRYSAYALTSYIDHFQSTNTEDLGWGCGWRNIQMLSSYLLAKDEDCRKVLFGGTGFVPNIAALQQWLEIAWSKGFDLAGAEHFNWAIYGSQNWIGTTECATLLRSFGVRAQIVDFKALTRTSGGKASPKRVTKKGNLRKQPDLNKGRSPEAIHWNVQCDVCRMHPIRGTRFTSTKRPNYDLCSNCVQNQSAGMQEFERLDRPSARSGYTSDSQNVNHQRLVDWVWNYFTEAGQSVSENILDNRQPSVVVSGRPGSVPAARPLYFQHQGHSRTVVGIQRRRRLQGGPEEAFLLILDPSQRTEELAKALRAGLGWQKLVKRGVHTLRKAEYQVCYVHPGIARGKDLEQLKTLTSTSFLY